MDKAEIAVVIVNWKVRDLLEQCLNSIIANSEGFNIKIFVVDNDSRDGTSEMVMMEYPDVHMIALPRNIGFAAANNMALKLVEADYVFLLNPDTEIKTGFFSKAVKYMKEHPKVGVFGPKILNPDGSLQLSVRRFPDLLSQILIMLKLKNILVDNKFLGNYLSKDFDYEKEQEVDQIMGAAMFFRKDILDKVGRFDERFFIWFEEVDLCKRARKLGVKIKYLPHLQILHHGGSSFNKRANLRKQWIFDKSLVYYFFKHKPFWQTLIILLLIPVNLLLTLIYVVFIKDQ